VNVHKCDANSETVPNHWNVENIFIIPPSGTLRDVTTGYVISSSKRASSFFFKIETKTY